jgi:hypothetical protein
VQPRALAQVHVADMVGQAAVLAQREVMLDQRQRGVVAQVDEMAQVHADVGRLVATNTRCSVVSVYASTRMTTPSSASAALATAKTWSAPA